jgi:hypothetical protein
MTLEARLEAKANALRTAMTSEYGVRRRQPESLVTSVVFT